MWVLAGHQTQYTQIGQNMGCPRVTAYPSLSSRFHACLLCFIAYESNVASSSDHSVRLCAIADPSWGGNRGATRQIERQLLGSSAKSAADVQVSTVFVGFGDKYNLRNPIKGGICISKQACVFHCFALGFEPEFLFHCHLGSNLL